MTLLSLSTILFTISTLFLPLSVVFAQSEMIQITVEVVEVNNHKAKELGIKWVDTIQTGEVSWSAAARIPEALPEVPSLVQVGDWGRWSAFTADLKLLLEKGAAKMLSKPRVLTKSGSEAKVIVGGTYPLVATGVGGGSVEWKEYGIKLIIKPVALPNKRISAVVTAEVSRLDWSNVVQGYPAIMTREVTSEIVVNNNDTLTIAGMIESKKEEKIVGVPLLMDIPILGGLFKRKIFYDSESNVVIFVTPTFVN